MTYRSREMKAGDIFHAKYLNYRGTPKQHFFYCVYTQKCDENNTLTEDVVGLLISTNGKFAKLEEQGLNDYNVKISIHNKTAWVCTDKIFRFMLDDETCDIDLKENIILTKKEKGDVLAKFSRFFLETTRQMLAYE